MMSYRKPAFECESCKEKRPSPKVVLSAATKKMIARLVTVWITTAIAIALLSIGEQMNMRHVSAECIGLFGLASLVVVGSVVWIVGYWIEETF